VVKRDFPTSQFPAVIAALNEYGRESWHREPARVRLAVLKLAQGNLKSLRAALKTAKEDFRDVLAYAEYPAYFQDVSPSDADPAKRRRAIDADWQQYRDWLERK
jgi:hypothetical protein